MDEETKPIKIRYSPEDYNKIKKKSKKLKISPNEYQKLISKKAKVSVELDDE